MTGHRRCWEPSKGGVGQVAHAARNLGACCSQAANALINAARDGSLDVALRQTRAGQESRAALHESSIVWVVLWESFQFPFFPSKEPIHKMVFKGLKHNSVVLLWFHEAASLATFARTTRNLRSFDSRQGIRIRRMPFFANAEVADLIILLYYYIITLLYYNIIYTIIPQYISVLLYYYTILLLHQFLFSHDTISTILYSP